MYEYTARSVIADKWMERKGNKEIEIEREDKNKQGKKEPKKTNFDNNYG